MTAPPGRGAGCASSGDIVNGSSKLPFHFAPNSAIRWGQSYSWKLPLVSRENQALGTWLMRADSFLFWVIHGTFTAPFGFVDPTHKQWWQDLIDKAV